MANDPLLTVRIVSPKGEIFNGAALSISSENSAGKFDVLPEHANFVTLIEDKDILVIKLDRSKVVFHYRVAILSNSANKVNIYTDIF